MKKNAFTYLSNITLILGGLLGGYALVDFIIQKSRLPEGACPLTDNKPIILTAIVFLFISFVCSILEQRKKKKARQDKCAELGNSDAAGIKDEAETPEADAGETGPDAPEDNTGAEDESHL